MANYFLMPEKLHSLRSFPFQLVYNSTTNIHSYHHIPQDFFLQKEVKVGDLC